MAKKNDKALSQAHAHRQSGVDRIGLDPVRSGGKASRDENVTSTIMSDMFQELPFAAILYRHDGTIHDCNKAACRMFGYSRPEMRALNHADLLPENFLRIMPSHFSFEVTTKGEFLWVCRRHRDGTIFQCEHSSKIIRADGVDYYFSCYRRTESGAMASPDLMVKHASADSPLVSAPICIFTWQEIDGELRLIGYNPAMDELTEGRIRQYAGSTAHELYEHRGRSDVIEIMYRVFRQRGTIRMETYCDFLLPGNDRFVDSVTFFMAPNLLIQFIEDITERRQALADLRESEERFKALYVGSPIPVMTWKHTGGDFILFGCNEALEAFTESRVAQLIGTSAGVVCRSYPEIGDDIRRCFETGTVVRRNGSLRLSANDEERQLVFTHAYVPGELVLTYINDITEQKQAEAELMRYQRQLSDLYEKHLDVLERERQRISQELHDGIGQYLSTIKVGTENLLLNNISEMSRQSVDEQLRANIALLKEAIMDVSKISMDLRPSILDDLGIVATINWFLREFGTVYRGITVEKDLSVQDARIPQHIKIVAFRILQEAMSNIAQHSGADRVEIRMREAGGTLEFTIRDNGTGFDVAQLQKESYGLGIAGMRERVSFSQGAFSIESTKGKGTVVRVEWPLSG